MKRRTKQQNGRKDPKNTRSRARAMLLVMAASVVSFGTAHAQPSKSTLDAGFAHVKHGVLFLCDTQGPSHSIASHTNWARGQDSRRVEAATRIQVYGARTCLSRGGPINRSNLEVGFGYLKQGTLILTGQTGPQHSIDSHRNWASGQSRERIIEASQRMLAQIDANLGPEDCTIRQKSSGRFLDAYQTESKNYAVVTRPDQGDDTQLWVVTGSGTVSIRQKSSGRFLDAYQTEGKNYAVVTRPDQGDDTQLWVLDCTSR